MKYIISIDQGTTGTTVALVSSDNFELIYKINKEFPQIFPEPGMVEHNLLDIWSTVESGIKHIVEKFNLNKENILSIGITNQRETTCAFKKDGTPLYNAIVWQDRRTINYCDSIKKRGLEEKIKYKTGLVMDPYFSASKMNWFLNNSIKVQDAAKNENLYFGTIDTFLLYKLTNCKSYLTDTTNASRTLLMNLESCDWDNELLELFQVKREQLPKITNSIGHFGFTDGQKSLPDGIPITGILGDQQAALFGQIGLRYGDAKCTYGTGAFALINTGNEIKYSKNGLLTTVAYSIAGKTYYALEGSSYIAGAAVQWLRDNLQFFNSASEIEDLTIEALKNNKAKDVCFYPYFSGIGTPYWKPEAKASIIGLTRDTTQKEISLACIEGLTLCIEDLIKSLEEDAGTSLNQLKVDGGAVANNTLCQIQANFSQIAIIRPKIIETTAFGAALASAIGIEAISMNDLNNLWKKDVEFTPEKNSYFNDKKITWKKNQKIIYLNN